MQQPPNSYPQQQWQQQPSYTQPQTYYPPQQQWQQSNPLTSQQQWYKPDYTRPPTFYPPPQPPIQRPKSNRVVLWVIVGIICAILAVLVVVSSVLIGYTLFLSPSHSGETISASTRYPTLHTQYDGIYTEPPLVSHESTIPEPMGLIITSNGNQGHFSGRMGILDASYGGDPFTGTLGVDRTVIISATPLILAVPTVFTGKINSDGSISGTTRNIYNRPATWKLFPVKGS